MTDHGDLTTEEKAKLARKAYNREYYQKKKSTVQNGMANYWARKFDEMTEEERLDAMTPRLKRGAN